MSDTTVVVAAAAVVVVVKVLGSNVRWCMHKIQI
jgi:hypothetical protein